MMSVARAASRHSTMRPKMGCAIVKGGAVLGIGWNRPGSTRTTLWSRHAEITAIIAAGDVRGATAYVYREHGSTGTPLLAKPCMACAEALALAGVRKVVWSGA